MSEVITTKEEKLERKRQQRKHRQLTLQCLAQQEDLFLDKCITMAEDEQTVMAKSDTTNSKKQAIDAAHTQNTTSSKPGSMQ